MSAALDRAVAVNDQGVNVAPILERAIAAKARRAQAAPAPQHWRREIQSDATRYTGAFRYELPGDDKTLRIAETHASTGTKVWDCAVALARMFESHQDTTSRLAIRPDERVLELGGGSGLLALALAALGADVTTTDAEQVVPHLRATIDANAHAVAKAPTVRALDWRKAADRSALGAFPVIVASDVLVCRQWSENVAKVLAAVAARARLVVVAKQRRRDGVAPFLEAVAPSFAVEEVKEQAFHPDYYHHDLQVLLITPRVR